MEMAEIVTMDAIHSRQERDPPFHRCPECMANPHSAPVLQKRWANIEYPAGKNGWLTPYRVGVKCYGGNRRINTSEDNGIVRCFSNGGSKIPAAAG